MNQVGTPKWSPEEAELERKRANLSGLEDQLAQRELELATLRAELQSLHSRYLRTVGLRFREVDDLKARLAEWEARSAPRRSSVAGDAERARARAEFTRIELGTELEAAASPAQKRDHPFLPSERLKALYRSIAKAMHPDLAADERDEDRRTRLMAEANRAYACGDEAALEALLADWTMSPEAVRGEGVAVDLVRVIRSIARVERRLFLIAEEFVQLESSELFLLLSRVKESQMKGEDLLAAMESKLLAESAALRDCLRRKVGTDR